MRQWIRLGSAAGKAPRRVGRYVLVESLGEGGMSRVHRARAYAAAGVTKDVCVKRIRDERLTRRGSVERFIEEARVSMSLAHGNIVAVFDFGRAGSEYFLAMEWIDGADLRAIVEDARMRRAPLPPEVVAHVGAEVARALAYAHGRERPVVHRDVKPANVLISRAGDVKLTDFGLATIVGADDGSRGGTAAYMAPEQVRGEAADVRSDIYSLGVMLCEMLTGERSAETLRHPEARVTAPLRDIVERLMSEAAADRPRTAREVAGELELVVGAARARGAAAPRDALAALAERVADRSGEREAAAPLDVDASYLRDGSHGDFADRLGATTATRSGSAAPRSDVARSTRARRAITTAAIAVALGVAGVVAFASSSEPHRAPSTETAADRAGSEAHTSPAAEPRRDRGRSPPTAVSGTAESSRESSDRRTSRIRTAVVQPTPDRPVRGSRARAAPRVVGAVTPAHLNVNAVPWAEVRIGDRSLGVTPLFGIELPPGPHTLRLANAPLGRERETRIVLEPGESRDLVIDMR